MRSLGLLGLGAIFSSGFGCHTRPRFSPLATGPRCPPPSAPTPHLDGPARAERHQCSLFSPPLSVSKGSDVEGWLDYVRRPGPARISQRFMLLRATRANSGPPKRGTSPSSRRCGLPKTTTTTTTASSGVGRGRGARGRSATPLTTNDATVASMATSSDDGSFRSKLGRRRRGKPAAENSERHTQRATRRRHKTGFFYPSEGERALENVMASFLHRGPEWGEKCDSFSRSNLNERRVGLSSSPQKFKA